MNCALLAIILAVWVKVVDITFDERGPKARLLPMLLWTTHKSLKAGMLRASAASRPCDSSVAALRSCGVPA